MEIKRTVVPSLRLGNLITDPFLTPEMVDFQTHSGLAGLLTVTSNSLSHPAVDLGVTRSLPHMVLKLAALQPQGALSGSSTEEWPVSVVAALHQLMTTITELRSPKSGWPEDLPQTPEAIAPYIAEELEDVFAALQGQSTVESKLHPVAASTLPPYQLLHDLEPWLIWCIARSGYEIMRLLEGVSAQVQLPDHASQIGVLRLCVLLDIKASEWSCALDLVTHEPSRLLLPADAIVQSTQLQLGHQATEGGHLLQSITAQVRATTPVVGLFLNGLGAQMLVPLKSWQDGSLQLHLGFEFVGDAVDATVNRMIAPEVAVIPDAPDAVAQPASATPLIRFTDANWLAQYSRAIAHHQLATLLSQSPHWQMLKAVASVTDLTDTFLPHACDLASHWKGALTLANRNFPAQSVGLDELALRVLWCFSRSSSDVLRWLGGMSASLLQPGYPWEQGTLRLKVTLKVSTPTVDWHLDLATGQTPEATIPPSLDGIVRSPLNPQPQSLRALQDHLWQQLQQTTPELLLLIQSTSVDLLGSDHEWQSGMLQLYAALEFLPDRSSVS